MLEYTQRRQSLIRIGRWKRAELEEDLMCCVRSLIMLLSKNIPKIHMT